MRVSSSPLIGFNTIKGALENQERKPIPTIDILEILEFIIMNNYFGFNKAFKQQPSGTAIGTKCAPTYAWPLLFRLMENMSIWRFLKNIVKLVRKTYPFLDLSVRLFNGKLYTDLHIKAIYYHTSRIHIITSSHWPN